MAREAAGTAERIKVLSTLVVYHSPTDRQDAEMKAGAPGIDGISAESGIAADMELWLMLLF